LNCRIFKRQLHRVCRFSHERVLAILFRSEHLWEGDMGFMTEPRHHLYDSSSILSKRHPHFSLMDTTGDTRTLSTKKGTHVVETYWSRKFTLLEDISIQRKTRSASSSPTKNLCLHCSWNHPSWFHSDCHKERSTMRMRCLAEIWKLVTLNVVYPQCRIGTGDKRHVGNHQAANNTSSLHKWNPHFTLLATRHNMLLSAWRLVHYSLLLVA